MPASFATFEATDPAQFGRLIWERIPPQHGPCYRATLPAHWQRHDAEDCVFRLSVAHSVSLGACGGR